MSAGFLLVYFGGLLALFSAAMLTTIPYEKWYRTTKEQVKYFLIYIAIGIIGLLMMAFGSTLLR